MYKWIEFILSSIFKILFKLERTFFTLNNHGLRLGGQAEAFTLASFLNVLQLSLGNFEDILWFLFHQIE